MDKEKVRKITLFDGLASVGLLIVAAILFLNLQEVLGAAALF